MKKFLELQCFGFAVPLAQATDTNPVEDLKRQLQQMQENVVQVRTEPIAIAQ